MEQNNKDKKLVLWIHGFAGRPDNETVAEMRKRCPQYEIYSIEVDHHALASMQKINGYIQCHDVALVAGTSCGGYYAMCAEFQGPKLVINPVTDPVRDLRQFIGHNTYKPGRPDRQTDFEFTDEMLQEFGLLKTQPLDKTICHHTSHDQVLGDSIKEDYQRMFSNREEIDERYLPNHFIRFSYVKNVFKDTLYKILGI